MLINFHFMQYFDLISCKYFVNSMMISSNFDRI